MLKWFSQYSQPAELCGMENLANNGSATGAEWVLVQPAPCYSEGKTGEGGVRKAPSRSQGSEYSAPASGTFGF